MFRVLAGLFTRIVDAGDAGSPVGRALLQERYASLQRQVPLLYAIALTSFFGLHLATGSFSLSSVTHPANLVILVVVVRLVYWRRSRRQELEPEQIRRELTRTFLLAGLITILLASWGIHLWNHGDMHWRHHVVLFGALAAVGCSYGLSSFPSAARLPLLFLALPLSVQLILSPVASDIGVGFSMGLVTLLTLRLINLQNRKFRQLVESRCEIAVERERARRAEDLALSEKAKVKVVADTDPLTGLANRRAFLAALEAESERARETGGVFALALVDLDGFKPINDTFGHATGDAVLIDVGERLREEGGSGAMVARMGGDEFALLLPSLATRAAAARLGEAVCTALRRPFHVGGREFRLSGCCGLTLVGRGGYDVNTALGRGDTALYSAKQGGRGAAALFSPSMERSHRRRAAIEKALRLPETRSEIELVFQPIFDLATHQLRSFEALARWCHPELGPIPPSEFVPIAEQINVIEPIGEALLVKAAREAAAWPDAVRLSFNLSAVQLCSVASAGKVLDIAAGQGLDPRRLQIEVTETALLVDFAAARINLGALRAAGARIVLDDFGAGHASISYLREMHFDAIKLDGSLISPVADSQGSRRLLKGVLDLCHSLGVPCIAEHIETDEQLRLLREIGCRDGQGFRLAEPMLPEAARALAEARVSRLPLRGNRVA